MKKFLLYRNNYAARIHAFVFMAHLARITCIIIRKIEKLQRDG